MKINIAEEGTFCLIRLQAGKIMQVGMSKDQLATLQVFLAALSKDDPFIIMGDDHELELKNK